MWQRDVGSLMSQNNWSNSHPRNAGILRETSGSFPIGRSSNKGRGGGLLCQTPKELSLLSAIKI